MKIVICFADVETNPRLQYWCFLPSVCVLMLFYLKIVSEKKMNWGFCGDDFEGKFGVGFTNGIGWVLSENYGTLGKV